MPLYRFHNIQIVGLLLILFLHLNTSCVTTEPESSDDAEQETEATDNATVPEEPPSAAEVLAEHYRESGDAEKVLEILDTMNVDEMDDESRLIYGILLLSEQRFDESRKHLEALAETSMDMAEAWFNLSLLEHAEGNEEQRDDALKKAIERNPSMVEALSFRGDLAVSDHRWQDAERDYRKVLHTDPQSIEALMGLAWVMAKQDRLDDAIELLDKAVQIDPEYTYTRVDRSRVNVSLGNYNAAEDDLDFVIEKEPDVPWHYLDRARIRLRYFNDMNGARSDLETVERLDPDNFFAVVYLAGIHDQERRFTLAESYYTKVIQMRPNYFWAYKPLGKFSWMRGEYTQAAHWFDKASTEAPEEFSLQLMYAFSLLRSGKKTEGSRKLAELLRKFKRGESRYEVIRFASERTIDHYAVNALNKETKESLRERLWFYMGIVYEMQDKPLAAQSVFTRIASRKGAMEYDLAWAALNSMEG